MATFITSKWVGQTIVIEIYSTTGYWKYNHNSTNSSTFGDGSQTITIVNANGEFTIIPCLSDGTPSGEITGLYLGNYDVNNQIISFDGTGLSSLTHLMLSYNGLSSLSGFTIPFSLTYLDLGSNQLTSFDGTGLSSLTQLYLYNNQLTSFDGTGLSSLNELFLYNNDLTSFDGTGLSGLTVLNLNNNQLTGFTGTGLSSLTQLYLQNNLLTSFDGTGLSSLTSLALNGNPLTSFYGTGLSSLSTLEFPNGWGITTLESINVSGMTSLRILILDAEGTGNPGVNNPQSNDAILAQLAANQLANEWENGAFYTAGGRTQSGSADYYYLQSNGWEMYGLSIPLPPLSSLTPTFTTSKAVGENVLIGISTSTGYWRYQHGGVDSGVYAGGQWIQVTDDNGEFALISCDVDGFPSGDITELSLTSEDTNQITSFNGTGLSGLINLNIENNQLTEFDGTGLSSLNELNLYNNQLTEFDGTGLSSLTR
jgi:Leucine-rich repeat (LRR) protein